MELHLHSDIPHSDSAIDPKSHGAFYTGQNVAEFMVWWAIRLSGDRVIDPSFGGGVFLSAACERIRRMGGDPEASVFGIEFDSDVRQAVSRNLSHVFRLPDDNLWRRDFFDYHEPMATFDAVIGNPPFIRYQR